MPEDAAPAPNRARLYVAAILVAGLVIAVLVVVLAGSGDEDTATSADAECVEAWNSDQTIVSFGEHQFGGHGYERVQVLRVGDDGQPTAADTGNCAVVFAARALDPEPGARAQVELKGTWTGFESLKSVTEAQIEKLQADAFSAVNANLTPEGTLAPATS